jgi:hypothetical protein
MASASFQVARGAFNDTLAVGAQTVTEATAAPTTANGIEVRIDVAGGWTKREIREALNVVWRFLDNPMNSTSIPI